jgi:hypothetical protein
MSAGVLHGRPDTGSGKSAVAAKREEQVKQENAAENPSPLFFPAFGLAKQ